MRTRLIIFILILTPLFVYSQKRYKIEAIDSSKNNYIIYLSRKNDRFILLSPKVETRQKENLIKKSRRYRFLLKKAELISDTQIGKTTSYSIDGEKILNGWDNQTIYFTDDLRGLLYLKHKCKKGR